MGDDWTSADQRKLEELEARERALTAQVEGDPVADAHVAAVSKPLRPEDRASSGFSPVRLIIGTGRDILNDALEAGRDGLEVLSSRAGQFALGVNSFNANAIVNAVHATGDPIKSRVNLGKGDIIPNIEGSENASGVEKITRAIAGFAIPYTGWAKGFKVAKAGTTLGRIGRAAAAGAATDFFNQDPAANNMATAIKDVFGIDDPTLDWLSYHEDDEDLVARLKSAATNLPVGVALDGLLHLGGKAIKAYGAIKGEAEEAKGIVEALEHDYGVKRVEERPSLAAAADAEAGGVPTPAAEPFDSAIHVAIREAKPQTWEDVLSFLERTVNDPKLKDTELEELAKIANGDPENALARLGIEPSKLDWHEFSNPEGIKNLHHALINVYEKVGQRLGRTGTVVGEAAIQTAARSMATDAEVLKTLFGQTKNLPEILMGARMFVGGHAHRLLDDAEAALDALTKGQGDAGAAWQKFLETFHRHALYLGSVRGAGSEIARALRSLRMIARTDPKTAGKIAKDVAKKVPAEGRADAVEAADAELNSVLAIKDDAEKIMLLSKILEKGDDLGELAQFIRGKSGSALKRLDGLSRETVGSLFSTATAAYNIKAGLSMISFRGLGRWMAAAARLPGALFSAEQARLARVAAADAWAYTDGAMGAVTEAVRNTMAVLEREGASELYINADNLGLKGLAKKAAIWNAEANREVLGKNFERIDIDATPRRFAFNPADRRALEELVDSENLPTLVARSLKWFTRAGGAMVNATGTAFRLGTILLINAPDQLIGTIAARAGAQSAAIREAAARAAELGIEGADLTKYLKARVASLATDVTGWHENGFEEGYREVVAAAGEHEARAVLFQDPLELTSTRAMSRAHGKILGSSLFIPFIHTPLRILERTLIDFTPLGLAKSRMRQAILHGTPQQREQALSQLGLGLAAMWMAYRMAHDRDIVGNDGDFVSSARMNRESYTMRIGADVYEFVRDDPLGTLLGLGADIRAAEDHYDPDDPEAKSHAQAMLEGSVWAVAMNTLSKTWLESVRNIADLAGALSQRQFETGLERYVRQTFARRLVPAAGLQKGGEMAFDPWERQAITFNDEVLKYTIGAYKLPQKRNWLGEPEEKNLGERFIGLTWKPEKTDPLVREMDRLSLPVRLPERDIKGVKLNATQYSRLLELRGEGVKKEFGTMREALEALIENEQYRALPDAAKAEQIRLLTEGYTAAAKVALVEEDPELHAKVIRKVAYDQSRLGGMSQDQLQDQNEALGRALGLIAN